TKMRTPALMIFGLVLSPCGWILDLTATVAPDWREIRSIPGVATDTFLQQGIWDICQGSDSSRTIACNQQDTTYFQNAVINPAKGLMVASLLVTLVGLGVAAAGVRCWTDRPSWLIAGLGGILIFLSGVMCLIPIAWYTAILNQIPASGTSISAGYCLILGYIGAIMEILAGAALVIWLFPCCRKWEEGDTMNTWSPRIPAEPAPKANNHRVRSRPPIDIASITTRSDSSVPYRRDSLDDGDFRAPKKMNRPHVVRNHPADADL
ncbi:CLD23 protein, partial [Amia calva]|nr:CLD23 protein [Amia calva]